MKHLTLLLLFGSVMMATGCEWLGRIRKTRNDQITPIKLEEMPAKDFVGYLNRQSSYLSNVRYDGLSMSVDAPGSFIPRLNSGILVCAKPRNFRMQAGLPIGGDQLDVGSNSTELWMYVKNPQPTYLYCTHADFPKVQADLPVPFEPDWVLQALGMTDYDPNRQYSIETSEKNQAHYLSYEDVTSSGQKVRKVTEFDGQRTTGSRPQVRRHAVLAQDRDGRWNPITVAEIQEVEMHSAGIDPTTGQQTYVQVPIRVVLKWPNEKISMELNLKDVKVNETISEQSMAGLFRKPARIDNQSPLNLIDYRVPAQSSSRSRGVFRR